MSPTPVHAPTPMGSPPLPLSWLQTGQGMCFKMYKRYQKMGSLLAPCLCLILVLCHPSQNRPCAILSMGWGSPSDLYRCDVREEKGQALILSVGSQPEPQARARSGCLSHPAPMPVLPPQGDTIQPTQLSLLMHLCPRLKPGSQEDKQTELSTNTQVHGF